MKKINLQVMVILYTCD